MAKNNGPWILGISASHHGGACLLRGDEIVVAIQEERLTRIKREKIYGAQNSLALQYCLDYADIQPRDLSMVVLSPLHSAASPMHDLKLNPLLRVEENGIRTEVIPHHYAHAVSVFATSGFEEAAVLVVDGRGSPIQDLPPHEADTIKGIADGWEMVSLYKASGTSISPLEKQMTQGSDWNERNGSSMPRFHSLGTIFSSVAEQIFGSRHEAGKVMGLAPYGEPSIPVSDFFDLCDGRFVFHDSVSARFTDNRRWPFDQDAYANLACSAQLALEEALLYLVQRLYELCPSINLCYAGGVALNSVANERIIREGAFRDVYIIPAAEDSGAAIGAAYHGLWTLTGTNTRRKLIRDALGRPYSNDDIRAAISDAPGVETVASDDYLGDAVELLCAGKNIGWFQGRSEFGPRALGQRSIISDPRRVDGKDDLNLRVKHREAFRPFAPVILREKSDQWFDWEGSSSESQFMLRVADFKQEHFGDVPAVVHVDGTGRVQTATLEANGCLYELVKKFYEKTGVPVLLNTSFNVMGMPIIETPADALHCFQSTGLDYCILGDIIVKKRHKILLGPDPFPGRDVDGPYLPSDEDQASESNATSESSHDTSNLDSTALSGNARQESSEFSFDEYVGEFEHLTDRLSIQVENQQLKGTFRGMTTTLERRSENFFVATGALFEGSMLSFFVNDEGLVDRVLVIVPAIFEDVSDAIFTRLPNPKSSREELVDKFSGRYELAGEVVEVVIQAGCKPIITAPGQPEYELKQVSDNCFDLKNTPGYSIKFTFNDLDEAAAAITQPNGTFILKKTAILP